MTKKLKLIASSRSRVTEVWKDLKTGDLWQSYQYKSGAEEWHQVSEIDPSLTRRYTDGEEIEVEGLDSDWVYFPAQR
jgi:uncharacterized protein YjlB